MAPSEQYDILDRRLSGWQIFFIGIGGIIGIGFFRDSSTTLAFAGPLGSLIAVVVVGIIVVAVMEGICEMVILWPIPNAMVKYINTFVDEDLGVAVGIMYWYLYCVTFSSLVITTGDLANYWLPVTDNPGTPWYIYKALIYVFVPVVLIAINCAPVWVFGWIEFIGGIVKVLGVLGIVVLMFLLNGGAVYNNDKIDLDYFKDGIQNNRNVASNHFESVLAAIPIAIFAYIGVELLTTTAFEARDPQEMKLPASNVGWFSLVLYALSTGSFVANVSWQDQQLPKLFKQALVDPEVTKFPPFDQSWPDTSAAPLIALLRQNQRTLPSIVNGCLIYSAVSCANTALYVASRQLYGLTRSIKAEPGSSRLAKIFVSLSRVHPNWQTPWMAIFASGLVLVWLPFIKLRTGNEDYLEDVVASLANIGSVSAIIMWFSQCVAYIMFSHWRDKHEEALRERELRWEKLFNPKNAGHFKVFQPSLAYLGAICTFLTIFFLNTISLWNGEYLTLKGISAFVSPAIVLVVWLIKKLIWPHDRRRRFLNLSDWDDFESRLLDLDGLIFPVSRKSKRVEHASSEPLMAQRLDPELDPYLGGNAFGAAAHRDQSLQTNPYNRPDLEPEGQGYGAMPVSPVDRSTSDVGLGEYQPQRGPRQVGGRPSQGHLVPPGHYSAHSGSSHELYEADTDISLVHSDHSSVPLRPVDRQQVSPQPTSGPESQWYGYGYGYGYGHVPNYRQ